MERRSTYGYIFIGTSVRYLLDASEGTLIFRDGALDENITELRDRLEQYGFLVTWRLSASLLELQSAWKRERAEADDPDKWERDRALTADEQQKLQNSAHMVRETMLAEAAGKLAYIATDKRHSVDILVDNIGKLMGSWSIRKVARHRPVRFLGGRTSNRFRPSYCWSVPHSPRNRSCTSRLLRARG